MKNKLRQIGSFLFVLLILSVSSVYARSDYYPTTRSTTTINTMDYEMTVNTDHTYDIHIKEIVTFHSPHHGILRAFAKSGSFYRELDGKNVESHYTARISDLKVESGQPYTTDTDGDAFSIQIGDANRYLSGKQEYEYSFKYDPGDDRIDSMDDVYQNILSSHMQDVIEHINITINMPKPFDSKEVFFYTGSYGSTEDSNIEYTVEGNTIKAHNIEPINPGEVLTCRVVLPEGYFVGATKGDEFFRFFYFAAAAAIVIALFAYLFLGRGRKVVDPITFYPPDGFDSAQVGYVLTGSVKNKYLTSLIIYFADKGWLTIENVGGEGQNAEFILHKITEIPIERPLYERTIFNALFLRNDNPNIRTLTNNHRMGEAFLRAQEELKDWFSGSNRLFASSAGVSKAIIFLCMLGTALFFGFAASFYVDRSISMMLILFFLVFSILGPSVILYANQKRQLIIGIVLTLVMNLILTLFVESFILSGTLALTNLILGTLGYFCNRRTDKGLKWYGECLGFKRFIKTAELDQLKLLVEENPSYYYKTLPYAYAMDLTDVWAKNFEGIALNPPTWYIDPYSNFNLFTYIYFMNTFHYGMNRTINRINTEGLRNMGSGGFGGGFMGGGFGGGGGGGMGGGSW